MIRKLATNIPFIVLIAVGSPIFSILLSLCKADIEWFQASGAVVTLCGVILAARKLIRLKLDGFIRDENTHDGGILDPEKDGSESSDEFSSDMRAYNLSFWFIGIGTLIWAYSNLFLGDIVSGLSTCST